MTSPLSSVSGLASGIDFQSLADAIIQARRAPIRALESRIAASEERSQAYLSLESRILALRDAAGALESASGLLSGKVAIQGGDGAPFSASATSQAAPGTYDVTVLELAARERLGGGQFGSRSEALGISGSFQVNGVQVELQETDSLDDVVARINSAGSDQSATHVRASVITLEQGAYRLVLSSDREGSAGIALDDPDGALQGLGILTGEGEKVDVLQAGADARLRVDGVEVTRSSNLIDDVVDGVTFTLLREEPAATSQMSVSRYAGALEDAVKALVEAYNGLALFAREQVSPEAGKRPPLSGDAVLRSVLSTIRTAMLGTGPDLGTDGPRRLADLGISIQVDGTFALDASALSAAVEADPWAVADLLQARLASSDAAVELLRGGQVTEAGTYNVVITEVATRALAEGAVVAPVITGVSEGDRVRVLSLAGSREAVVELEEGMTLVQLADQLNAALQAEGLEVEALVEGDRVSLRHQAFGSNQGFQVSLDGAAGALTGLDAGEYRGTDVVGTVNGQEASGSGRILTVEGEGPAQGLVLRVTDLPAGGDPTVTFERGIAAQVRRLAARITGGGGSSLQAARQRLETGNDRLRARAERFEDRLELQRAELNRRFAAVEQAIARAQDQGSSLAAQLTQIGNFQWGPRRR